MAFPPSLLSNAFPIPSLTNNLFTQDLAALGLLPPSWGLFTEDGSAVVEADSVTRVEYRREWNIADFPIERGGFETYDKVENPFIARVTFVCGGSQAHREAFLNSIEEIAGDLELYTLVTPEISYPNVNITHYDYTRTATQGLGLMAVTIWVQEVREGAESATVSKEASGAAESSGGQVQSTPATPAQKTSVLEKVFPSGQFQTQGAGVDNT